MRYCCPTGLSRLNRASSAACTAGSGAFSLANGPPGMAFMAKKVIADMMNTVTTASNTRLIVYFSIQNNLSFAGPIPTIIHSVIIALPIHIRNDSAQLVG